MLAIFFTALGAALMLARSHRLQSAARLAHRAGLPFPHWLTPVGALLALGGVALLERFPLPGILTATLGAVIAFPGGGWLLLPGLAIGFIWAARRHAVARLLLGFGLLLPGLMSVFYSLEAGIGLLGSQPLPGLPPGLSIPAPWLWLLLGLPPAWLGAWLLLPAPLRRADAHPED